MNTINELTIDGERLLLHTRDGDGDAGLEGFVRLREVRRRGRSPARGDRGLVRSQEATKGGSGRRCP